MSLLTRDELRILVEKPHGICVSIYMPTHRAGRETRQDPIRLKNMLREAEERLNEMGLSSRETNQLLEPAQRLLDDTTFWQHQSDGLAILSSSRAFRCYRLPLSFDELVVVTNRFHIKPLLALFACDGQFYVLALSQNEVRLLQGTRYGVDEVDLPDVPRSLAEALRYDDPERQLQFHTPTPVGAGGQAAIFHGHGVGTDDAKANILRYFHQIDRGVSRLIRGEQAPLVLAGVDYLLPIYRQANTYPQLLEEGILGNPEGLTGEELHDHAWAIVEPHFLKAQGEASARYRRLAGTDQASSKLAKVVAGAYQGKIEELFVALGVQRWGAFDPDAGRVLHHPEAEPGDEDLLDFAAIHTLLHGGTVYAVSPEEMPDETPVAAVFRY